MPTATAPAQPVSRPILPAHHRDADVIARLVAGDEAAFRALIEAHHGTMLRVARGYVRGEGVAEEVVQETWVAILKGLPRFQGRSSLKTWMFRILANRARTRGRREHRTIPVSALGALDADGQPAVDPDRFTTEGMWARPPTEFAGAPDAYADRGELGAHLLSAIDELPERQKLVITLRDVKGWSSEEVCNVLEVSATNQRVLLHRARSKVRAALETYLKGEL